MRGFLRCLRAPRMLARRTREHPRRACLADCACHKVNLSTNPCVPTVMNTVRGRRVAPVDRRGRPLRRVEGCDELARRDDRDRLWKADSWRVLVAAGPCTAVGACRCACRRGGANARSGRAPFVSMMKATDLRDGHDVAIAGRRDRMRNGRVFIQRQVRARSFVVRTIEGHQPPQACFANTIT